jgi:hypothetical protein
MMMMNPASCTDQFSSNFQTAPYSSNARYAFRTNFDHEKADHTQNVMTIRAASIFQVPTARSTYRKKRRHAAAQMPKEAIYPFTMLRL